MVVGGGEDERGGRKGGRGNRIGDFSEAVRGRGVSSAIMLNGEVGEGA